MKESWLNARKKQWGETSAVFLNRVSGKFAVSSKDGKKEKISASTLLALVDSVGIGLGVLQRMRQLGYRAQGFSAGKRTRLTDKSGERTFSDWRSCMWWLFREMLEPGSGFDICLPPDKEDEDGLTTNLIGDLTAPRYSNSGADGTEIRVESKDKIRLRLHRSTDCGDAVLMAIVGPILLEEELESDTAQYHMFTGEDL